MPRGDVRTIDKSIDPLSIVIIREAEQIQDPH